MRSRTIKWTLLSIIILMTVRLSAQGEAAVPFLQLAPDSRAGGLG
jgi:hypothetical protein